MLSLHEHQENQIIINDVFNNEYSMVTPGKERKEFQPRSSGEVEIQLQKAVMPCRNTKTRAVYNAFFFACKKCAKLERYRYFGLLGGIHDTENASLQLCISSSLTAKPELLDSSVWKNHVPIPYFSVFMCEISKKLPIIDTPDDRFQSSTAANFLVGMQHGVELDWSAASLPHIDIFPIENDINRIHITDIGVADVEPIEYNLDVATWLGAKPSSDQLNTQLIVNAEHLRGCTPGTLIADANGYLIAIVEQTISESSVLARHITPYMDSIRSLKKL